MLEIKNLSKTYNSKNGIEHKALKNINLKFEEKGLVFILGKSGSGKSTFLNVVSGLDSFDSGEILICDKSTKDFSTQDFDAYRNTYLGFIFQEYNILNEFSIRDNISLALELQGKEADDKKIEEMLKIVDLEGLKDRKPSELSGGQKQRIAIARALIKDPEIIFGDEPTGNLDSSSGEQVFEFVKELSKNKLVIIVTHDRESAFKYGDRIIELSDGEILIDITKNQKNDLLAKEALAASEVSEINYESKLKPYFSKTKAITVNKNRKCNLIKSKLPSKVSWKIATNNIGVKKGRLIVTILLIVLAISMFGFTEILADYDITDSTVSSFNKSNIDNIILKQGEIGEYFEMFERNHQEITPETINHLQNTYPDIEFSQYYAIKSIPVGLFGGSYLPNNIAGVVVSSEKGVEELGYEFIGTYPKKDTDDVVISDYMLFMCLSKNPSILDLNMDDFLIIFSNMEFDESIKEEREAYALIQMLALDMLSSGQSGDDILNNMLSLIMGIDDLDNIDNAKDISKNTETFNLIWKKFLISLINQNKKFKSYNLAGVFITNFQQYIDFLQMTQDEQKEDERALELAHLLSNYYSIMFVSQGFLDLRNSEIVRIENMIVDTQRTKNEQDLLQNIDVKYNKKWLQENPDMLLAEDEIIITDILFQDIFGGLTKFETNSDEAIYDTNNKDYKYIYTYKPYNSKIKQYGQERNLKVVGVFDFANSYWKNLDEDETNDVLITNNSRNMIANQVVFDETKDLILKCSALYLHLPESDYQKTKMLNYICDSSADGIKMYHYTSISEILYAMNDTIFIFQKVFIYLSYIMGAFSILLLVNFMTTSVMNKKRDIGVLRALGARSQDVSKIFLNEASVIGAITTVLSCGGMSIMTYVVNATLRQSFMKMFKNDAVYNLSLLTVTVIPYIIVIFASAFLVYTATILPARKISRMLPVDAIKKA